MRNHGSLSAQKQLILLGLEGTDDGSLVQILAEEQNVLQRLLLIRQSMAMPASSLYNFSKSILSEPWQTQHE